MESLTAISCAAVVPAGCKKLHILPNYAADADFLLQRCGRHLEKVYEQKSASHEVRRVKIKLKATPAEKKSKTCRYAQNSHPTHMRRRTCYIGERETKRCRITRARTLQISSLTSNACDFLRIIAVARLTSSADVAPSRHGYKLIIPLVCNYANSHRTQVSA